MLEGRTECASELARLVTLRTIDDLWADYLAQVAEFRSGFPWLDWSLTGIPFLSLDRRDPQYEFAQKIHLWFQELEAEMPEQIARRVEAAESGEGGDPSDRGAVWTYLTTDQPFGSFAERMARGLRRPKLK